MAWQARRLHKTPAEVEAEAGVAATQLAARATAAQEALDT